MIRITARRSGRSSILCVLVSVFSICYSGENELEEKMGQETRSGFFVKIKELLDVHPWRVDALEELLHTKFTKTDASGNKRMYSYTAKNIGFGGGVVVESTEVRALKEDGSVRVFNAEIDTLRACVSLDEVRRFFPGVILRYPPLGDSPDAETIYAGGVGDKSIFFGFRFKDPRCLSSITMRPAD